MRNLRDPPQPTKTLQNSSKRANAQTRLPGRPFHPQSARRPRKTKNGLGRVTYQADRRSDTFNAKVTSGNAMLDRIRFRKKITRGQAALGTGIVTLDYKGDADTRPEEVRLRAASRRARLDVDRISLTGDRLAAKGSVTSRAEGIMRFRYSYIDAAGNPQIHPARATIQNDGDWELKNDVVPPQLAAAATCRSCSPATSSARSRGEMLAYQLNPGQTRKP